MAVRSAVPTLRRLHVRRPAVLRPSAKGGRLAPVQQRAGRADRQSLLVSRDVESADAHAPRHRLQFRVSAPAPTLLLGLRLLHSRNFWNSRSCSAASPGAARAACCLASCGSILRARRRGGLRYALELLLRHPVAGPARHLGGEIDALPFRVIGRLWKLSKRSK